MRLTEHTDYALRLLMFLGTHRGRLATTREVAALHGISHHHLTKVVNQLGHAGFVETVRGRCGGIRLARAPADIMVGDVVRHTEPDFHVVACLDGRARACPLAPACVLKGALCRATACFLETLDGVALSTLIPAP
jgi:Rrf2 family transcriptional regulator, nitric oxide-sensitive transcriptional repressor